MDNLFRKRQGVLRLLFSIIVVFGVVLNACSAEAKSLKKGEVYSLPNGRETIEVISSNELEITEGEKTIVAEYDFKGDKLRVVANVMGTKVVIYYLLTNEGLKEEKTGQIYYTKAALEDPKTKPKEIKQRAAIKNFEVAIRYVQAEIAKRNIDITKVTTNAVAVLNAGNNKNPFDNTKSAFVEGNNVKHAGQVAISATNIRGLSAGSTVTIKADVDGDGNADTERNPLTVE